MTNENRNYIYAFDMDNTLIMTNKANNLSYKEALSVVAGIDIQVGPRRRITRDTLCKLYATLSEAVLRKVVAKKEALFAKYIGMTALNGNLCKLLRVLHERGDETILLTNSRRSRALMLCQHYGISSYFTHMFFREDYARDKYDHLRTAGYDLESVVLFENSASCRRQAVSSGISSNNVIRLN